MTWPNTAFAQFGKFFPQIDKLLPVFSFRPLVQQFSGIAEPSNLDSRIPQKRACVGGNFLRVYRPARLSRQIECVELLAGMKEQELKIAEPLGVAQRERAAIASESPVFALANESSGLARTVSARPPGGTCLDRQNLSLCGTKQSGFCQDFGCRRSSARSSDGPQNI